MDNFDYIRLVAQATQSRSIMPSNLEALPVELFAMIAEDLDVQSLSNLRLTGRQMAYRATMGDFSRCFCSHRLELTRKSLESFLSKMNSFSQLGRFVEDLTLVSLVHDTTRLENLFSNGTPRSFRDIMELEATIAQLKAEEMRLMRDSVCDTWMLLRDVFALVKSKAHRLERMSLQVAISDLPGEPPRIPRDAVGPNGITMLRSATTMFQRVLLCLRLSQLPVHSLDVFHASPESLHCSVACDELAKMDLAALSSVRSLSISVSASIAALVPNHQYISSPIVRLPKPPRPPRRKFRMCPCRYCTAMMREENFKGLSSVLSACPQLEDLRVSFYTPDEHPDEAEYPYGRIWMPRQMHRLSTDIFVPKLRKFSLGGLCVESSDVIAFIENHRATLESFEMGSVRFVDNGGRIKGVIDHLKHCPRLNAISLSEVYEVLEEVPDDYLDWIRVLYDGKKEQACTTISGGLHGRSGIRRWGDDVREPLSCYHGILSWDDVEDPDYIRTNTLCLHEFGRLFWQPPA